MRTIFKISVTFLMLFSVNLVTAQTFKTSDSSIKIKGFNTQASQDFFLLNQSNSLNKNLNANNNSVYVSQVGSDNVIRSTTRSIESNINVIQNGSKNNTVLALNSNKITERVLQKGNNNLFLDYSLFKTNQRNVNVNQTGNNQNLVLFGSNSLSEKMKVLMKGQDQNIIIRNF